MGAPGLPATGTMSMLDQRANRRVDGLQRKVCPLRNRIIKWKWQIYWDQASLLVQLGLLDARTLPVAGTAQTTVLANERNHVDIPRRRLNAMCC
jgi:hypothetical protein